MCDTQGRQTRQNNRRLNRAAFSDSRDRGRRCSVTYLAISGPPNTHDARHPFNPSASGSAPSGVVNLLKISQSLPSR